MPIDDLISLGAPEEVISEMKTREQSQVFEVWPEHWDVLHLFMKLSTQWVLSPAGDLVGLNYCGVKVLLDLSGLENKKQLFEDLQIMENEVVRIMRERKK